ncbi:TolC family protein [Helicobacter sp.]|uniref:TolC family protein n=1 Tax=Helicobacter sp. TaxID=218 RepID=UPI0025C03DA6|nr:TolC family protein [Helicobacter sp.]MCI5632716.1 TolC family protein [Helicobacter sp.]MDY5556467.1 TolC family protein [Helicobacter sp.]
MRFREIVFFGLFCTIFTACSVQLPDTDSITQNIPDSFNNTTLISIKNVESPNKDTQTPQIPSEQIKLLFQDSTLHSLFDLALANNLDLQITNTRILQAQAQLKSAFSELFPRVDGNLNANTSDSDEARSYSYYSQLGATLSWEVDLFGRLRHSANAKVSLYEKSLQDLENAKITLLSDVATLYFTLLETQANIILTQENIVHYTNALELTQLKVENGLLDSTELFEKQDFLTNEQNILENLKSLAQESQNALLILLNTNTIPQFSQDSLLNLSKFLLNTKLTLNNLPANTLLARPDIKAALFSLHAQIYNKANAKASLFPIISISANMSEILDSNTLASGNLAWQLASSLSAPILNRTQLTQNYFLQDAILQESYLTLQKSLKSAFYEIENASFNTKSTLLQLDNSQKRLNNAQNYYEFSYHRHSVGLVDTLEHALNSASFNNSKKSLNTAASENLKAFSLLYKAFGGNLNLHKESYAINK